MCKFAEDHAGETKYTAFPLRCSEIIMTRETLDCRFPFAFEVQTRGGGGGGDRLLEEEDKKHEGET